MRKWDHLIQEADTDFRSLERAARTRPNDGQAVSAYVAAMIRLGKLPEPERGDLRYRRVHKEFAMDPGLETARALLLDVDRIKGPNDTMESSTQQVMGKMGSVCHQANQTQITTRNFIIHVSYDTPVAYIVRAERPHVAYVTDGANIQYSPTTKTHIRCFERQHTNYRSHTVPQAEIREIYRAV